MAHMIDLIRQSGVPASLMRTAARGALSLPTAEMLEILVLLATHPIFGEQARLTLAGWDEAAALPVLSDPQAPPEVLDYFSAPANLRPALAPALLENPAIPETRLLEMARSASRELLGHMMASKRVRSQPEVARALLAHPGLGESERAQLQAGLEPSGAPLSDAPGQEILEPDLSRYLREHAAEITAAEGKPFHLIDWTTEEQAEVAAVSSAPPNAGGSTSALAAPALGLATAAQEREYLTPVQRIAKLSVRERVQLAIRGDKDERFILIRDGVHIVSAAVLESGKIGEAEVESFAAMRNVGEHVLRIIASKRRFMRQYSMKRTLTSNPRCPLDVSLPLTKELLPRDLKNLMANKNVSDTLRRFAYKVWKQKTSGDQPGQHI